MILKEHKNFEEEVRRLKDTVNYITNAIMAAEQNREIHKDEIKDAYINLDYLDSSQSYVSIMLHTRLLDELERSYENLLKAKEKPYFARIDFKQEGKTNTEKFYIGKMSLFRPDWEVPMILDWRSPLASVYYDGKLGNVTYDTNTDTIKGELSLKRQYTIENEELLNIMDIDITATDTFLQASLGENKDTKLKDIVSTIQSEQNAIIRASISKPLIVQGVAGSGKTTIALHRIAYLIYTYEDSFYPENFMIIAPNNLFLNYISDVLPELGANNVYQTTFVDLMLTLLGNKFKLTDPDEKLMKIIGENSVDKSSDNNELLIKSASFKGSLSLKNMLKRYIRDIEKSHVPNVDFKIGEYTFMTVHEIKKIFLTEYKHLSIYKRVEQIEKHLKFRLKNNKKPILEKMKDSYDTQIENIRFNEPETEERRLKIVDLLNKRDSILESFKKNSSTAVKKYMANFEKKSLLDYYKDFIADEEIFKNYANGKLDDILVHYICTTSEEILDNKKIEFEDLSPLAYLKYRIFGFDNNINIKYVVIDEAQDFSHFQLYALKKIFDTDKFTILGDLSQGIHSYRAIKNWNFVLNKIFDSENSQYLKLEQSYRTTIEIMNLANKIISKISNEDLILAKPVIRHGESPVAQKLASDNDIINSIETKVAELLIEGYKTISIVGKTKGDCEKIYKMIKKNGRIDVKLLEDKDEQYDHNIVLLPSYLSKGLEFDAVIVANIDDVYTEDELDLKLLYVAMTRAQHRLYIFYKEGTINFIESLI